MSHESCPVPQVTLISENVQIPSFSGNGSESVQTFVCSVEEECIRRAAHNDAEKLAILKSRISSEPSSLAGKLIKSDKFLSFTKYDDFKTTLITHFLRHTTLGPSHSFLKLAQTAKAIASSTHDICKAENIATSLSVEVSDQLKTLEWIDADG